MDKTVATQIVLRVWNGVVRHDDRLPQALACVGMTPSQFDSLRREAREQECGFSGRLLLTPTSLGRNR